MPLSRPTCSFQQRFPSLVWICQLISFPRFIFVLSLSLVSRHFLFILSSISRRLISQFLPLAHSLYLSPQLRVSVYATKSRWWQLTDNWKIAFEEKSTWFERICIIINHLIAVCHCAKENAMYTYRDRRRQRRRPPPCETFYFFLFFFHSLPFLFTCKCYLCSESIRCFVDERRGEDRTRRRRFIEFLIWMKWDTSVASVFLCLLQTTRDSHGIQFV